MSEIPTGLLQRIYIWDLALLLIFTLVKTSASFLLDSFSQIMPAMSKWWNWLRADFHRAVSFRQMASSIEPLETH